MKKRTVAALSLAALLGLALAVAVWVTPKAAVEKPLRSATRQAAQSSPAVVAEKESEVVSQRDKAVSQQDKKRAGPISMLAKSAPALTESAAFEKAFADAEVLDVRESKPDRAGRFRRAKLLSTKTHKYGLIYVAETWARPRNGGADQLLSRRTMVADHIIVKLKPGATEADLQAINKKFGAQIRKRIPQGNLYLVQLEKASLDAVKQAVQDYSQEAAKVAFAEPDHIVYAIGTPDDPDLPKLWGMNNTGQTGGMDDADIDALEAWGLSTGSKNVIVAVIDTGVNYNHPDLVDNIWTNPGEIPGNGIDDDGNGYVDDVHGYDFVNDDGDPIDDHSHGSHCSGTIGGKGNNGTGVVGVNWNVSIMGVKFLSAGGWGSISDAVQCVYYSTQMGAFLSSNSWGGGGYSQAMKDAIDDANAKGVLFIAAAGNSNNDNDAGAYYPCGYTSPNVISVAATDHNDNKASFSSYGATTVHLGAPGVSVWSTVLGSNYASYSGTSMATPHVSGVAALLKSFSPGMSHLDIKQRLMDSTDPIAAMNGKTISGGRLNAMKALVMSVGAFISLKNTAMDDDSADGTSGNGDGFVDAGETIGLTVTLNNVGGIAAPGVAATLALTEPDAFVTVTQDTVAYGDLAPNAEAAGFGQFLVAIDPASPTNREVALTLTVQDTDGGSWEHSVTLEISAPGQISVAPANFALTVLQGEQGSADLTIANSGPGDLTAVVSGSGFTPTGLWHQTTHRTHSGAPTWYYGIENQWDYDTGSTNSGTLTAGPLTVPAGAANLSFWFWKETENYGGYDYSQLLISTNGGGSWTWLFTLPETGGAWQSKTVDLAAYAGQQVLVRFMFDTVDSLFNDYEGVYLDEIQLNGKNLHWLSVDSDPHTITAGGSATIPVAVDASQLEPGVYVAELLVNSNDAKQPQIAMPVTLTVLENTPPVIDSAPWATPDPLYLPATATMAVVASDVEAPEDLTYTWSIVTGPGAVTFTPNGTTESDESVAAFDTVGTYEIQVSVSDGVHTVEATTTIEVRYWAPEVTGAPQTNDTTPTWTWIAGGDEGIGVYRYQLDSETGAWTETPATSFTPAAALTEGAHTLYVQEQNAAGNWSVSGNFAIVIDTTAPTAVSGWSPADGAIDVPVDTGLVLVFSENVSKGNGSITIKKYDDDSVVEVIDVASAQVTVDGNKISVALGSAFPGQAHYYVLIAAGAIEDLVGNDYAGITDKDAWDFTTDHHPLYYYYLGRSRVYAYKSKAKLYRTYRYSYCSYKYYLRYYYKSTGAKRTNAWRAYKYYRASYSRAKAAYRRMRLCYIYTLSNPSLAATYNSSALTYAKSARSYAYKGYRYGRKVKWYKYAKPAYTNAKYGYSYANKAKYYRDKAMGYK